MIQNGYINGLPWIYYFVFVLQMYVFVLNASANSRVTILMKINSISFLLKQNHKYYFRFERTRAITTVWY